MRYYPVYLDLRGRPCRVFGAGDLAASKVVVLLAAGAKVTVIASHAGEAIRQLDIEGRIEWIERDYRRGDLHGSELAIDASQDESLHPAIAAEARASRTLLNVVDRPSWCDFITPAVVCRGDLTIAVSTGGASPALARRIGEDLGRVYGEEYGQALQVLRAVRERLTEAATPIEHRRLVFKRLAASPLCRYLRDRRLADVDRLLADLVGPEVSLASLNLDLQASAEP